MRVWAVKGTTTKPDWRQLALADAEALLGEHHHTASLGRLVGQACQLSRIGKFALANAANGQKGRSLTVAERDSAVLSSRSTSTSPAASTARPLVASTLAAFSRLMPAMPIADSSARWW